MSTSPQESEVPTIAKPLGETTQPPPARLTPIAAGERIDVVDVLRGFAILGILLVNMQFFTGPFCAIMVDTPLWPGLHDRVAAGLIRFFAEGKFYSLFSLLFGFGMVVQMLRAEQRRRRFVGFFMWRLFLLLLIGAGHALLLWTGDILMIYALLGFVLLLFRKRKPTTLLVWTCILLLLPTLMIGGVAGSLELARGIPEAAAELEAGFAEQEQQMQYSIAQEITAYGAGSYADIMRQRVVDLQYAPFYMLFAAPSILAMFILGIYTARHGILHDIPAHLRLLRHLAVWGAVLGVLGNSIHLVTAAMTSQAVPTPLWIPKTASTAVGVPALCLFYAATLVLLWQKQRWRRRLEPLAAVGRMALTNYLLQSLICTTIFYSYGLGLYGGVGPAAGLGLTIVVFLLQVLLSNWWLARFRFGPMEWLWRSLTYRKIQPMLAARRWSSGTPGGYGDRDCGWRRRGKPARYTGAQKEKPSCLPAGLLVIKVGAF